MATALAGRDQTETLGRLASALQTKELPDLAFEASSRVVGAGQRVVEPPIMTYGILRDSKGEQAARAWLAPRVGGAPRWLVAAEAIEARDDELVWDFGPAPTGKNDRDDDFTWLARAAAVVRQGTGGDPHLDELRAHYAPETGASYYHVLGRHVLGLVDEATAAGVADDAKKSCEASFYMGVRAMADGRFDDASDDFRSSVETGSSRDGEYHWSREMLWHWRTEGVSLSRLAARRAH
jgi:hypothetical protein